MAKHQASIRNSCSSQKQNWLQRQILQMKCQTLLKKLCTLPGTFWACKQSISTLRRGKTYLKSTMGQWRLNVLLLMNVHYAITVDISKILADSFARNHSRRMVLTNILQTCLKFTN